MSEPKEIEKVALNLLARREHSKQELLHKLVARHFVEEDVQRVIQSLSEKNYQSDDRFAEAYVTMRIRDGYGPVRIRQELEQRGVASDLIDNFLELEANWNEQAQMVRYKKFGVAIPADFAARMKQMRFLQYRGFTSEQIRQAIESVYENE